MLSFLDGLAIVAYFVVLLVIGWRIMVRARGRGGHWAVVFWRPIAIWGLVQTTASTAATDLGGGFSIAMGGLGFTLGISGSWLIAISGLSVVMVSFLLVPRLKLWSEQSQGLTTGDFV